MGDIIQLTQRWFPLKPHPIQSEFYHSSARQNICTAGRRSGKTELRKRRVLEKTWYDQFRRKPMGYRRGFFAPTREQVKDIYWRDLLALIPEPWIDGKAKHTELSNRTKWGSTIRCMGMDKPERAEGGDWDEVSIDEYANTFPGSYDAHIRPMLAPDGQAFFYGVPDMEGPAQSEYESMVIRAELGNDPNWRHFTWPSADIRDPRTIEEDRKTMDPLLFRQEYCGEFVTSTGKFAPDYDVKLDIGDVAFDPNRSVCWSLDFNIGLQCSGVIQHHEGFVNVLDELCVANSKTETVVSAFIEYIQAHDMMNAIKTHGLKVYGDASGIAKDSTSGISDWYIIKNMLKNLNVSYNVLTRNRPIADTRNAVNARIKNAAGERHTKISRTCKRLPEDLRSGMWPSDLADQHCLAWFRYFCIAEYPVVHQANPSILMGIGYAG